MPLPLRKQPLTNIGLVLVLSALAGGSSGGPTLWGQSVSAARAETDFEEPPRLHRVAAQDLLPYCEREGRVDSVTRMPIAVYLEEYAGLLEIVEVGKNKGPVVRGDVILRLEPRRLDRVIAELRDAHGSARRRLNLLEEQERLLSDRNRARVEKLGRAKSQAENDLATYEKYDGPKIIRAAEIALQDRENSLSKKKEQLKELEGIYEDPQTAGERGELVLERARRNVAIAETLLELARNELALVRDVRHPERLQKLRDQVRWESERQARAEEKNRVSEVAKKDVIEAAERTAREVGERLVRLERDRERFTVIAPRDGTLAPLDLHVGDLIAPRVPLTEIYDPRNLIVRLDAPAEHLRILTVGKPVTLKLSAYQEVTLSGSVASIEGLGTPIGEDTLFPVTIAITGTHSLLRIGLRCVVSAEGVPLAGVLTTPRDAIRQRNGRPAVRVWKNGTRSIREVILGPGNLHDVQVLDGLQRDELVILPRVR